MAKLSKTRFDKDHLTLGVVFVCMMLLVLAVKLLPLQPSSTAVMSDSPVATSTTALAATSQSLPVRLQIPRINLDTTFTPPLGLRADGEVAVPDTYDQVGWYKYSPVPGAIGPTVVLGHVDSYEGPAVLYSIGQLRVGDQILVTNASGTVYIYEVEASEKYEQDAFPTQLVYGDLDYAGLRLITCSGWYDREAKRYSHNRVVFARLIE